MANYTTASLFVLTAATDFTTEATHFQNQADVPADSGFTSRNGTVRAGNISLGSDNTARRTWLRGRRPIEGQLYPRGVYNK